MSKYAELFKAVANTEGPTDVNLHDEAEAPKDAPAQYTLLFVDDEESVLKALRRIFMEESYNILTASSAEEALAIISKNAVNLVISDHRMPGMTGAQLLKEIKQAWPETIRIMLTGYADIQSIMGAVNEGAVYKFITKPWNDDDLRLTVSLALQQYALLQENRKLKEITQKQEVKIKNYSALFNENRGMAESILVKKGMVSEADIARARKERRGGELAIEAAARLGLASESKIAKALQEYLKYEYLDLREYPINARVAKFLPKDFCEKSCLIPLKIDEKGITVAMADPSDIYKCDNIALMTGLKISLIIARPSDIRNQIARVYEEEENEVETLQTDMDPIDEIDIIFEEEDKDLSVQELLSSSEVPPIIRITNAIISEAIRYEASDIHIEPKTKYTVVRYRIDGMLHSKIKIPLELHPATISRIKIIAKMDISERRKPQDGRITVKSGTKVIDIRVSTMPTINGEKVVMRLLDKSGSIKKLDELGIRKEDLSRINILLKKPQGIIISTGPTGSGKTTMLYSLLNSMLQSTRNYQTIEDPVEYFFEDVSQIYVKENIGFSFASVLRATLRQDPDVIMVGEVRDQETADITFKAALTGHMVLTTLHTNSSVASITRLMDMGVKPYLIASALEGIIAQRLVRKVCRHCKTSEKPDNAILEMLKVPDGYFNGEVFKGKGCERCNNTGYHGRTGIFEIFLMNDDFRHLISTSYKEFDLLNLARAGGMKTLIEDGLEKVKAGDTTLDEILRVVGAQTRLERECHSCHRVIDAKYIFCPFCGTYRQNFCRNCAIPLEEDWRSCPLCGAPKAGG